LYPDQLINSRHSKGFSSSQLSVAVVGFWVAGFKKGAGNLAKAADPLHTLRVYHYHLLALR